MGRRCSFNATSARRKVETQLKQLAHIEEMVASDPDIMRGTAVFKGTRIPVDLVAYMLSQGATAEENLKAIQPQQEKDRHRAAVHARLPTEGAPQAPSLGDEGPRREIFCTELFAQECMRFLIDECLHESLVRVAHAAGFEGLTGPWQSESSRAILRSSQIIASISFDFQQDGFARRPDHNRFRMQSRTCSGLYFGPRLNSSKAKT